MKRILIGTPTYDGRLDVWYTDSLLSSLRMAIGRGDYLHGVYTSYDALIQRSRNALIRIALQSGFDDLVFIDSDVQWRPEDLFRVVDRGEAVIGGPLPRRSDTEGYGVQILSRKLRWNDDHSLLRADGLGTGFLKLSRPALLDLWRVSEPYKDDSGEENRMVFDIKIVGGELISEDYVACRKLKDLGYDLWLDPDVELHHIGNRKWGGDFKNFIKRNGYE